MKWLNKERKIKSLECDINELKAELSSLWDFEKNGGYVFGNRDEILQCQKRIARKTKKLELAKL